MNDDQVERLLNELASTRESFDRANVAFDSAIRSIRWNKINTRILYFLIVIVFLLGALGVLNFMNYRSESCDRYNGLVVLVRDGMESNGFAIGAALAVVFNADQEDLDRYLEAYNQQKAPDNIPLREC